jgi:dihydropyrimidinase
MLDLTITGSLVATPQGAGFYDVGIKRDKIVAVQPAGTLDGDTGRVVHAAGRIAVPGGIDPHIHADFPLLDAQGSAYGRSADAEQVSRAALFGGTTTWVDFVYVSPGGHVQQAIDEREARWHGRSHSDYCFHIALHGKVPPAVLQQLPEVIQGGYPSIKIYTTDVMPSRRGRKMDFGSLWEVLQVTAKNGGIAAIHAEDDDLVMHMYERLTREGRTSFRHMPEVHSTMSEDLSFRRVIRLAEHVEGAALYIMHVSSAAGVEAIAEARSSGFPIYGETLHQYTLFDSDAYERPNGQIYHTYPSLKTRADGRALWAAMGSGVIQTVATDGICTSLDVKIHGERIDDTVGGSAGVEARMGIIYTEAVVQRGLPLTTFVDITSANAARLLGLYPRKGAIAPGSDADIVLIDPTVRRTLSMADLHESDYSPWQGWEIAGWPVVTILRGKVVVEDGKITSTPGYGESVHRRVSDAVLSGVL